MEELLRAIQSANPRDALDIIERLRREGATQRLSEADPRGGTAPLAAAYFGRVDVIRALHDAGVNLSAAAAHGLTPAHVAALYDRAEVIRALDAVGADLNVRAANGLTAAQMADQCGHAEVMTALHSAGVNLDELGGAGYLNRLRETVLMESVVQALSESQVVSHNNLAGDLKCPVSLTAYTTRGATRPVKLPDGFDAHTGRSTPGTVLSAAAASGCMQPGVAADFGRPPAMDPLTRHVFTEPEAQAFLASPGFVQGDPARLALAGAVFRACEQTDRSPAALTAAAVAAATPAPLDYRAILAAHGSGAAARSAGGAAGPRLDPRPHRGGPTP